MKTESQTIRILLDFYRNRYPDTAEYCALDAQWKQWAKTKPLQGKRILDGTPLFFNTFGKYIALLLAGAELTVAYSDDLPYDPEALAMLEKLKIPTIFNGHDCNQQFDVILDCAGILRFVPSRFGYAELTRSGILIYQDRDVPLFAVDSGRIKQIETCLGTGESCLRALRKLGYQNWQNVSVLQFGYGKVGRGIAMYLQEAGADVTVVDKQGTALMPGIGFIDMDSPDLIRKKIKNTQWLISVTGVYAALAPYVPDIKTSNAIAVNMGAVDEFGALMEDERVLYKKQPLNFMLEEPTLLRYIDATMALDNAAAAYLCQKGTPYPAGTILPPPDLEQEILATVFQTGLISKEIEKAGI